MAKQVKFGGRKKPKGGDTSFDFGYNRPGAKKPKKGKAGGRTGGGS